MDTANVGWPCSLWVAVTPPGPDLPRLIGTAAADVVVIGGSFTGLSAALHLREAGVDVAIVEAMEPGWGASGRNNGQVIPTLSRHDPEDIIARHGQRANVLSVCCVTVPRSCSISRGAIKFRPSWNRPVGFSRCTRPGESRSPSGGSDNGTKSVVPSSSPRP